MDRGFSRIDVARILQAVLEQFSAMAGDLPLAAPGRRAYVRGCRDAVRAFARSLDLAPSFVLVADVDLDEPAVLDAASCRWARTHCLGQGPGHRAERGARC